MNIKQSICLFLLLAGALSTSAQTYVFKDVKKYRARGSGEIFKDGAVQGYYSLLPVEREDRKNTTYEISILDNNLAFASSFDITRPKSYYLMETSFNDEAFIFQFYDTKRKAYEFTTFDRAGKQLNSIVTDKLNMYELQYVGEMSSNEDVEAANIYVNGSDGFMTILKEKFKKVGYTVAAYDNNLEKRWTYSSDQTSPLLEIAEVLFVDDMYVLLSVSKKTGALTKKFDTFLVLLDAKTGKEFYNFQMQDNNEGQLSVLNSFMFDDSGDAYIIGEYYAPGDDVMKDKSMGMYIRGVEKNGEYNVFKKYSWDGDIARVKKGNSEEDDSNDKMLIYFHNIIRTADGKIFAVAEQYRKQLSLVGALGALDRNSNTAGVELKVTDMVLAEFDSNLELVNYTIFPKKRSRVLLPKGAALSSPQALGYYVKLTGGFDYFFTSSDKSKDVYNAIYIDMNRREENSKDKADAMIGSINIEKGNVTSERFPVNTDSNGMRIMRAKPGYIMIKEYFRKERKISYRLEKITT